ncbi:hypothetical protein GCM10020218_056590 [Dactylosporangium vinaceum]
MEHISTSGTGWWKAFADTVPDGYLALIEAEEEATEIVHFHPMFVPGLLQTEAYASALTESTSLKGVTHADVERLVRVRMLRQKTAFRAERPRRLTFVLDESCLHRPVGDPGVMCGQLEHLLELHGHPTVSLTVTPFGIGPHPGLLGPFLVLDYPDGADSVLCFEWQQGNTVVRGRPDLIQHYRTLVERLTQTDPTGSATEELLRSALRRAAAPVGGS